MEQGHIHCCRAGCSVQVVSESATTREGSHILKWPHTSSWNNWGYACTVRGDMEKLPVDRILWLPERDFSSAHLSLPRLIRLSVPGPRSGRAACPMSVQRPVVRCPRTLASNDHDIPTFLHGRPHRRRLQSPLYLITSDSVPQTLADGKAESSRA